MVGELRRVSHVWGTVWVNLLGVLGVNASISVFAQAIGIGTTMPTAMLHIEAASGYTQPLLKVGMQGSGTSYLIVLPNGNMGISVMNPTEALDVAGNIQFSGALMPGGNAGNSGQILVSQGSGVAPQWQDPTSIPSVTTDTPIIGDGSSGNPVRLLAGTMAGQVLIYDGLTWSVQAAPWDSVCHIAASNMLQKWTGGKLCNSLIYDDGVNVGIGTTSPTHTLHVAGAVYVQDSLRLEGDLRPGGNPGSPGQVLVSQGPGVPPAWQYLSSPSVGACVRDVTPCLNAAGDTTGGCSSGMTLSQCVNACRISTYGGFTDWRVPTRDEYFCLYAEGFPFDNATVYYWTVTVSDNSNGSAFPTGGVYAIFRPSNGTWDWNNFAINNYCRCVR